MLYKSVARNSDNTDQTVTGQADSGMWCYDLLQSSTNRTIFLLRDSKRFQINENNGHMILIYSALVMDIFSWFGNSSYSTNKRSVNNNIAVILQH